jgi:hypothetical protein
VFTVIIVTDNCNLSYTEMNVFIPAYMEIIKTLTNELFILIRVRETRGRLVVKILYYKAEG